QGSLNIELTKGYIKNYWVAQDRYHTFYTYKNGTMSKVAQCTECWEDGAWVYRVNDSKVSKTVYDSKFSSYNDGHSFTSFGNTLSVATYKPSSGAAINQTNLSKLKQNPRAFCIGPVIG
ncbi:MAG: hypothetical protein HUJ76_11180, partial [Parasporobacterium sp.]|nr:hypothetical protein [Parasporobacterium sp.]